LAFVPGTRLGPYEIVAPLGSGGMGEVYRARDTKLSRDVAIKVLPDTLAHDHERLARFEPPRDSRGRASSIARARTFVVGYHDFSSGASNLRHAPLDHRLQISPSDFVSTGS
jgi:eukaryotic-like serine/threonine-protein kinase